MDAHAAGRFPRADDASQPSLRAGRVGGRTTMIWRLAIATAACLAAAGCSVFSNPTGASGEGASAAPSVREQVPAFAAAPAGVAEIPGLAEPARLNGDWEPWIVHPSKVRTQYRIERTSKGLVLRADANASASGLLTRLRVDPNKRPFLEWQWRVDSLIEGADNSTRHAEDSPVRVVLAFDGDHASLPFKDRLFFEQARLIAGYDMPYATLMYIWENQAPVGTVIQNAYTSRIRKMVVSSGPAGVQQWQSFRRNIVDDYRAAYGTDPGRLIGIAVFSDTDNTRGRATAWYGDIRLTDLPPAGGTGARPTTAGVAVR